MSAPSKSWTSSGQPVNTPSERIVVGRRVRALALAPVAGFVISLGACGTASSTEASSRPQTSPPAAPAMQSPAANRGSQTLEQAEGNFAKYRTANPSNGTPVGDMRQAVGYICSIPAENATSFDRIVADRVYSPAYGRYDAKPVSGGSAAWPGSFIEAINKSCFSGATR